jgi:hypothetical protein
MVTPARSPRPRRPPSRAATFTIWIEEDDMREDRSPYGIRRLRRWWAYNCPRYAQGTELDDATWDQCYGKIARDLCWWDEQSLEEYCGDHPTRRFEGPPQEA